LTLAYQPIRFGITNQAIPSSSKAPIDISFSKLYQEFKSQPMELKDRIISPREDLVEDIFKLQEQGAHEGQKEQHFKTHLLTRHSLNRGQENNNFLQRSCSNNVPTLFNALLPMVEQPNIPLLIERAVLAQNTDAFNKLITKVSGSIPSNTLQWVAECGQPDKLQRLFSLSYLDKDEKKRLWKIARQQHQAITDLRELPVSDRQVKLFDACKSPIGNAAQEIQNRLNILALLQTPGIDINAENDMGFSPIHLLARINKLESIQAIIKAPKININKDNRFKVSALHMAASCGFSHMVSSLLQAPGIKLTLNGHKQTPIDCAALAGHSDIAEQLKDFAKSS
jgi:hypothetical protein